MSTNTLETAYANGEIIDASHINELTLALLGDVVGRSSGGVPESGKNLGTLAIPWGNLYATGIILNGTALDTSQIVTKANRIVSGATRSLSSQPDFLRANGAALEFNVLGATTNLVLSINNTATTVSSDITKTGVTAAPSTNNTALVNDTGMSNDLYAGEDGSSITIDTAGSEITNRIGQIAAFKTATGEIFQAFIKSATELTNVFRGFYFNSSGNPLVRGNLSNNDTLTLMNIGWVFIEDNGSTVDLTYNTPSYSYSAPSSPSTGDYWFDISNQTWKRYSGTSFEIIDRTLVGQVVSDSTNTIASRSFDFANNFDDFNNIVLQINSNEIVESSSLSNRVNVYGTKLEIENDRLSWNITTDLETGLTEASSTLYYLYLSSQGQSVISNERPYYRPDLKGFYHPYHAWRAIGEALNNGSSDITFIEDHAYKSFNSTRIQSSRYDNSVTGAHGSTNTAIPYFGAVTQTKGRGLYKEDNSSTLGLSFTILKKCRVRGSFNNTSNTSGLQFGFSKNSSQLTTVVGSINVDDKLAVGYCRGASTVPEDSVSFDMIFEEGDIIRPHTNGSFDTPAGGAFIDFEAEEI